MNIYLEILLRTIGVFLSVYFTIGWGKKSSPGFDEFLIITAVVAAVVLQFYQKRVAF